MLNGQLLENSKPVIYCFLIFNSAADRNIAVPTVPVVGDAIGKALNSLRKKEKIQIGTLSDHFPTFSSPSIGILDQEIA